MATEKPRVVHLVPRDGIGGVERAARSMLEGSPLDCEFKLQFIEQGGGSSENNPIAHFQALKQIISVKPNLLLCSLWRSVPVGILVKIFRPGTKLVFFLHTTMTTHFLDRFLSRLMLLFCDSVWADSGATISSRIGSKKGFAKRVISFVTECNPTDLKQNDFAPRFVFWGRLHSHKGLDTAIKFIHILIQSGCPATFEIWGPDGGERNSLSIQIEKAGLKNQVILKGATNAENLNQIAEGNCFYLQLSRNEGMAMSVVEAMQRSLVPIVTAVGEIGTYCSHGYNAILVNDPANPIEAVNDVVTLMNDESRYRRLQLAAQAYWAKHPLYRDDICAAANELCNQD